MANADNIKITVLEDGTIKVETDGIGQANHMSADMFLKTMAQLAGGESTFKRKTTTHSHHGHTHTHEHDEHSH